MSNFSKVSVGVSNKRYTHDLSFDNNTSANFGGCQPLFSQYMMEGDKLSGDIRQLVRLSPMPVPTFGRMRLVNKLRFVPIADICPYFEAMLANAYVNNAAVNYIPKTVPVVDCAFLTALILCRYSVCTYYTGTTSAMSPEGDTTTALQSAVSFFDDMTGFQLASDDLTLHLTSDEDSEVISFNGADFVISDGSSTAKALTFRLTDKGKRLRSILLGLGYAMDLKALSSVSLLPLLAYYKAYFDSYAPKRTLQWNQTNAYVLIDYMFENYVIDFHQLYDSSIARVKSAAVEFIEDLASTYYTISDDYISAHVSSLNSQTSNLTYVYPLGGDPSSPSRASQTSLPSNNGVPSRSGAITDVSLQILQRFSRWINKDSVIGKRVSTWLKVHYGADVASSFFKDSISIDDIVVNCDINDIFSTSDTKESDTIGDYLGSYAGKGLGFGNGNFSFTAPTSGYFIVITCVVPDSGYCQGIDPTLFGLDRFTLPSSEFDALGYEVTPRAVLASHNDLLLKDVTDYSNQGFGFIPRFSGFKTRRNIVNGDMSRRGTIASYSPYYLDRLLTDSAIVSEKNDDGTYTMFPYVSPLPLASEVWRYPTKYSWLGDFNRIFYNSGNIVNPIDDITDLNTKPLDDNFLIQSVINLKLTNKLKPMAMSYDTFDDDVDTGTKTVSKQ